MKLGDIEIPTRKVEWGQNSFEVRGISLGDISVLVVDYREHLNKLISDFVALESRVQAKDKLEEFMDSSHEKLLMKVLSESPNLIANVIAAAAGEPDQADKCKRMPITIQQQAILDILELTLQEAGGLKKFLENLIALLGLTTQSLQVLKTGIGTSGVMQA